MSHFIRYSFFVCTLLVASACQAKETLKIELPSGEVKTFSVDIARTPEEQQQGLMFVESMPEDEGMLFVYPEPQYARYWMKNTLIPLDMLFFDDNNTLVHIEHSAEPGDLTPRGPNLFVCSVLEINGGLAKELGIEEGAKLLSDAPQECINQSS